MKKSIKALKANFFVYALISVLLIPIAISAEVQCNVMIGDFVWNDLNQDGIQDTGESGIPGIEVFLYKDGNKIGTTTTNADGGYLFSIFSYGDFYIKFTLPSGYTFSPKDQGGDDAKDSDVDSDGKTKTTSITTDVNDFTWDAGIHEGGDIPPPTPPTFDTNTSLLWENNVVINDCDVSTTVRFVRGQTVQYTIPGPYPSAFDGSVDVFLSEAIAWDGYCDRPGTGDQPNERFRVLFKKGGSVVWSSPYTGLTGGADGIDTGVISDEWIGILGNPVNLPNGADEIVLEHWSVGNGWDTNANSVVPSSVCIAYETVTPQHPNCDYLYAVADDGDKLVYLPRDGSNGATLIGPLGVSSVEAITISLDESTLYAANYGTFGTINWNTGAFSAIGNFGTGGGSEGNLDFNDVDGLAFDPSTGDLYGTLRRNDGDPEDVLFKINTSTGSHIPNAFGSGIDYVRIRTNAAVGLWDVDDIAIDPADGQMYGVVNSSGGNDRIVRIDKVTGIVTDVGRLHTSGGDLNDMEGLSFHNDGNFYGTTGTSDTAWIINTSTALCTEVHSMDIYGDYEAIAGCIDYTPITSIGDFVWYDGNENGMQNTDGSSVGVPNVTVQLFQSGGASAGSTTTNSDGYYSFTNLTPGDYYLKFSNIPGGYVFTDKDQGTDDSIDSDVNPANGQTDITTLSAGEHDMTWDAGIHEGGDIPPPTPPTCDANTSLLWENNVVINGCDVTVDVRFVRGQTVQYTIPGPYPSAFDGSVDVTISEAVSWDGYCDRPSTGDQPNERFRVVFKKGGSVVWSSPYTGVSSSDDGIATGVVADDWVGPLDGTVNLPNGADQIILEHWSVGNSWDTNANSVVPSSVCINYETPELASVGDFVWFDLNMNGIQDAGEPGILGVLLKLYNQGGTEIGSTTTNSSGWYEFTGLSAGTYTVEVDDSNFLPGGVLAASNASPADVGSDDAKDSDGGEETVTLTAGENNRTVDFGYYVTAGCQEPTYDSANVDGNTGEWNLANDFFASMYRAGNPNKDILSKLYLRYDCTDEILYVLVLAQGDQVDANASPDDHFVKLGNTTKLVDANSYPPNGTQPEFTWVGLSDGKAQGWEASMYLTPDEYDNFNVHTQIIGDETSAVSYRSIELCIYCTPPQFGSIGNWVWHDTYHYPASGPPNNDHDVDGIQDVDELGIESVLVELLQGGSVIDTETTDAGGFYLFTNLAAGDYIVRVASSNFASGAVLEDWYAAPQNRGGNDALDSDGDGSETQPFQQNVSLSAGENDLTNDFGFFYTCVDLIKTGPEKVKVGEIITYHFRYENCGDIVHHTGAHVYDPMINPYGDHEIWNGVVWPGQVVEFDKTYQTTEDDCEKLKNCAWAIGHTVAPYRYSPDLANDRDDDCWEVIVLCCEIKIGDYVWWDENHNGLQDDDALFPGNAPHGLNGVRVILYDGSGTYLEETTTSNGPTGGPGWYEFTDLLPGDYTVTIDDVMFIASYPDLIYPTYDYDGIATEHTTDVTLTDCEKNYNLDFGYDDEPLPVTLSSFTAVSNNGQANLKWTTESEIENQGFLLERRIFDSGDEWQEIASYLTNADLLGQGTVTHTSNYTYIDNLVQIGHVYEYRLADVDYDGIVEYHSTRTVTIEDIDLSATADKFTVKPAYPNPFNPSTNIEYSIPKDGMVNITIYDLTGQRVSSLLNTEQTAGWHKVRWNGNDNNGVQMPAGIYLVTVNTGNSIKTMKLIFVK